MNSIAFSLCGTFLISGIGKIKIGSSDNTLILWNIQSGQYLKQLKGHTSYVYSVAFAPDSDYCASGNEENDSRLSWYECHIMGSVAREWTVKIKGSLKLDLYDSIFP